MANKLLTLKQARKLAQEAYQIVTAPGYVPPEPDLPEDLTKLSDEELETRIWYSQDHRAREPFGPLFEEYKSRYKYALTKIVL